MRGFWRWGGVGLVGVSRSATTSRQGYSGPDSQPRSLVAVRLLPVLAVFLVLAMLPAAAGAAVFCAPAPCSEGTSKATIKDALNAADANPGQDVVAVTAGTHNVGTGLVNLDEETELRGAGVGKTIITGDDFPLADPGTGRTLIAGKYSSLHDMTLRLPSAVTSGPSSWTGADIYDAVVEDLAVDAVGATFGPGLNDGAGQAMLIRSGTIRNLVIDIPLDADASGLQAGAIGGTFDLADVTISAPRAFASAPQAAPDPVTVRAKRFRIRSNTGAQVVDGFLELSDSVIDVSAAPASPDPENFPVGIQVFDGRAPSPAGLTMDRVTLTGNGDANATAMSVAGQGAVPATNLQARHVAASGFGRTLGFANFGSNPSATISFSNVPIRSGSIFNFGTDPATLGGDQTTGNRGGEPMLLPNLGLPFGSPAVDIGGADLLPGAAVDLAGNPRPADGDGDGSVLNDAGAFERVYSPPPGQPVVPVVTPAPLPPLPPAKLVAASLFTLPSAKRCVSRRAFRIRLHKAAGGALKEVRVFVNGKRVRLVRGKRLSAPVNLRGLPKGRFTVQVAVIATDGRKLTERRRYRTCTPKRR